MFKVRCRTCGGEGWLHGELPTTSGEMFVACPFLGGHPLVVDVVDLGEPDSAAPELELEGGRGLAVGDPAVEVVPPPSNVGPIARLLGLDLSKLKGTGDGGAVTFEDLERAYNLARPGG